MDNQLVKKLTGKDRNDYELAAAQIVNNSDLQAFSALVEKSDFLFDFIKENVKKRLANVINQSNFKNLLAFFKVYSYDYEDVIVSSLVKFADEDLTDEMLDRLENGSDEEKAYAAKYFSKINDSLSIELLRQYSDSEFDPLALNCAEALSAMKDEESLNSALNKLKSDDDFEKLSAIRFLVAFKAQDSLPLLFEAMKTSSMAEHIAAEIPYLKSFSQLLESDLKNETILALCNILNGLGEIVSLSQVFDFELFEVFDKLMQSQVTQKDSTVSVLLLGAREKFNQLTENDEYIFDESKEIKAEIQEIKNLLNSVPSEFFKEQEELLSAELSENSDFVFFALNFMQELGSGRASDKVIEAIKNLLDSSNQTLILKSAEVLKALHKLDSVDPKVVLSKVSDENIKSVLSTIFD